MLQEAPPAVEPATFDRRRQVLVVDDNHDAADGLGWLLETMGVEVRIVYDGAAALALIRQWHPELVLLDVGMPGMNGLQVASEVRSHHDLDDVRLVALSGGGLDEDRQRSLQAGFDHYLIKPAAPDHLAALLNQPTRAH